MLLANNSVKTTLLSLPQDKKCSSCGKMKSISVMRSVRNTLGVDIKERVWVCLECAYYRSIEEARLDPRVCNQ